MSRVGEVVSRLAHNQEIGSAILSPATNLMARDSMLVEFLKKESATTALMVLLTHLNVINHISRPMRRSEDKIYISTRDIKVFCERWVKTHSDR